MHNFSQHSLISLFHPAHNHTHPPFHSETYPLSHPQFCCLSHSLLFLSLSLPVCCVLTQWHSLLSLSLSCNVSWVSSFVDRLSDQPPQLQQFSFSPRFQPDTNLMGQQSFLKLKLPLNVKMVLVKWNRLRVKENPLPIQIFISVKRMFAPWVIAQVLSKRVTDPDYLRAHLRKRKFAVELTADIRTGLEGNFAGHGRFKPVMPSGPADFSISVLCRYTE